VKTLLSTTVIRYLRLLAKLQLAKIQLLQQLKHKKLIIVGITGSAGKTSCLFACQAALTPEFRVHTNYTGGNSETGIPLGILGLKTQDYTPLDWLRILLLAPLKILTNWHPYDILLLEMGIDSHQSPKNMAYLLTIVKPQIGIFLNVTSVHLQNFPSLTAIALEKAKLINSLPSTGTAIINIDDPLVRQSTQITIAKKIPIKPIHIPIPNHILPPIYNLTLGAAINLAQVLQIDPNTAIHNISANFHLPPGRSSLFKGIKQSQIIDSSYNSSPLACQEMLSLLKTFPNPRIAILGDMRELGPATAGEHQKIYQSALKAADQIISVGQETFKHFGPQATKFLYWWQALEYLQQHLPQSSTILVKGSQNTIFLEELVKGLLANQSDSSLLCRQSNYWLTAKHHFKISHSAV